jgi:hypothetical protein
MKQAKWKCTQHRSWRRNFPSKLMIIFNGLTVLHPGRWTLRNYRWYIIKFYESASSWKDWSKLQGTSVRIWVLGWIRTEQLPETSLNRYRHANPLGGSSFHSPPPPFVGCSTMDFRTQQFVSPSVTHEHAPSRPITFDYSRITAVPKTVLQVVTSYSDRGSVYCGGRV